MTHKCTNVLEPLGPARRVLTAHTLRVKAADFRRGHGWAEQQPNGDDCTYADRNYCASFTKGLPHHKEDTDKGLKGEVKREAYEQLRTALQTGEPRDFAKIPLGATAHNGSAAGNAVAAAIGQEVAQSESRFAAGTTSAMKKPRPLVNPQAALAYDLQGFDSHQLAIDPAPVFNSAEAAGEMIELYWMALARDVPFTEYGSSPIIQNAIADLNAFAQAHLHDFTWPVDAQGQVTPQTLFRGSTRGESVGPYISQFMLLDVPFGAQCINQKINTTVAGQDYMTDFHKWLEVQTGLEQDPEVIDKTMRYIRNGRDLGQYVHVDVLFQAYFNAMLLLLQRNHPSNRCKGLQARFDAGNPYRTGNQEGFGTQLIDGEIG